jgi:hypothetical protein
MKISLAVIHLASWLLRYYVEPAGQEQWKFVDVGNTNVKYLTYSSIKMKTRESGGG